MFNIFQLFLKYRKSDIVIFWDDTNYPYTRRGKRREGSFMTRGFIKAYLWGKLWCICHPRAEVNFVLAPGLN